MRPRTLVALLTGPAGAGKTAVAELIARRTGAAHVEEDVIYAMQPCLKRDPAGADATTDVIALLCRHFVSVGRPVIIEGILCFRQCVSRLVREFDTRAVCRLSASVDTCLGRNRQRGPGGIELPSAEVVDLHGIDHGLSASSVDAERGLVVVADSVQREFEVLGWMT